MKRWILLLFLFYENMLVFKTTYFLHLQTGDRDGFEDALPRPLPGGPAAGPLQPPPAPPPPPPPPPHHHRLLPLIRKHPGCHSHRLFTTAARCQRRRKRPISIQITASHPEAPRCAGRRRFFAVVGITAGDRLSRTLPTF